MPLLLVLAVLVIAAVAFWYFKTHPAAGMFLDEQPPTASRDVDLTRVEADCGCEAGRHTQECIATHKYLQDMVDQDIMDESEAIDLTEETITGIRKEQRR